MRSVAVWWMLFGVSVLMVSSCRGFQKNSLGPDQNALFYEHAGSIWSMSEDGEANEVVRVPEHYHSAVVLRDGIVAVTERGTLGRRWGEGQFKSITAFPTVDGRGALGWLGESTASFSWQDADRRRSRFGVVNGYPWKVTSSEVSGNVSVVGFQPSSNSVLLQPRGQDPAFKELWLADLSSGHSGEKIQVSGYGSAAVAPAGKKVVSADRVVQNRIMYTLLRYYELTDDNSWVQQGETRVPDTADEPRRLAWSPAGNEVYLLMVDHEAIGDSQSASQLYLWRWGTEDQALEKVSGPLPVGSSLEAVASREGLWIIRGPVRKHWHLLHGDGRIQELALPAGSMLIESAGWRLVR